MNASLTTIIRSQVSFWKKTSTGKTRVATAVLLTSVMSVVQAVEPQYEELEPCLNGEVSASGTYASDAEETLARSRTENAEAHRLALEPCVNGEVSATGVFPTQAHEDHFNAEQALEQNFVAHSR